MASKSTEKKIIPSPLTDLSYEQALSELETIVARLETESNSLEESLALFERGQALARLLETLLENAELKIQQLNEGILTDFSINET